MKLKEIAAHAAAIGYPWLSIDQDGLILAYKKEPRWFDVPDEEISDSGITGYWASPDPCDFLELDVKCDDEEVVEAKLNGIP